MNKNRIKINKLKLKIRNLSKKKRKVNLSSNHLKVLENRLKNRKDFTINFPYGIHSINITYNDDGTINIYDYNDTETFSTWKDVYEKLVSTYELEDYDSYDFDMVDLSKNKRKITKFKNRNLSRIVDGNDESLNSDSYESYVSAVINSDGERVMMVYDDSNNLLDESYGYSSGMDNLNYNTYDLLTSYLDEEFPNIDKFIITIEE